MNVKLPNTIEQNIQYFTGRTWLLPRVIEWLEQTEERIFILTGEPGTGKSMIVAWLAGAGPLPEDAGARGQLEQIRSLVKAAYFCVAASGSVSPTNFAENVANQLTYNVSGFSDALAASLEDRVQISTVQQIGKMENGSSVTGVHIEQLDLGELGEESSFERALHRPLRKLCANGYNKPILLLVDALDEAATYTGAIDLVRLLVKLSDLPQNIRVLVTTRPDPRVLKFYNKVKPFDLFEDAPKDVDDVRRYAYERLAELEHEQRTRLADRIAQAAQRIFLYAHLVINDLLARLPEIPDLDAISLPKGLSGLYHDFLNRELGTDEDRWYSMFKPLLGLIAVAQEEGLTRTQIEHILSNDVEQPLRICKQYLTGNLPDGPFSPFHKSFADFLLEDKENLDYHIDAVQMHRQIAEYYLKEYSGCWEDCDLYGLGYLPSHLWAAGQQERLRKLLFTFDWLQARLAATDVNSLIADYDLIPDNTELRLVQDAIRLSGHVLAQDHTQLASRLHGHLCSQTSSDIKTLLNQTKGRVYFCWLRPTTCSLAPPGGALFRTLKGHSERGRAVAVTPDGHQVVSASDDRTLKVWDLHTGKELWTLKGHSERVRAVAVTPDGQQVVSASNDKTLKVWDLDTGKKVRTLEGHSERVRTVAVTPNGQQVVSGSHDRTLRVWDLHAGEEVRTLRGHFYGVRAVAMTPNGRQVVSASWDKTLMVWDLSSGEPLKLLEGHSKEVYSVAVTPDGQWAVSASKDHTLMIWDLRTRKKLRTLKGHSEEVRSVAVTPDGQRAVSASHDSTLKVWNLHTGKELRTLTGHSKGIRAVAVTPDGQRAVSASCDTTLKVWDLLTGDELGTLVGHSSWVEAVAVMPDGQRAVSASWDKTLKVWDLNNGEVLTTFYADARLECCTVSLDGLTVVAGDRLRYVHFLQVENLLPGISFVTAWKIPQLAFGCTFCHTWSIVAESDLGHKFSCSNCQRLVKLNPFTINADWQPVAKAWGESLKH